MHILIAADIFPPQSGGPATYAVTLANELTKRGVSVTIVSLNPDGEHISRITYHVSKRSKIGRYLEYFWRLFRHAKSCDVLYAMGPVNSGLPALIVSWLRRKKLVVKVVGDYAWEQFQNHVSRITYHVSQNGDDGSTFVSLENFQSLKEWPFKIKVLRLVERLVVRLADRVIVPSEYLKRIVRGWGATEEKVEVIYNAVEFKAVEPAPKPANEQWIVSVGRLVPWKGMSLLIEVVQSLLREFPETRLKIIGDGPCFANLKSKIINLNSMGTIELLGNLSREKTLAYIHAADVFVLNSGYEGLSHVILEALSLGRPVLASNVGGNPEVVMPGKTGELFEYNDKATIEPKIIDVLKNKRVIHPMLSSAERILFFKQFQFETMIGKTIGALEEVCRN